MFFSHAYRHGSHRITGCILKFIPAYSPDLNPIEESFSAGKVMDKKVEISAKMCCSEKLDSTRVSPVDWLRNPNCRPL